MAFITTLSPVYGHQDIGGYSGAFSWWRNNCKPWLWSVCDHTGFGSIGIDYAVTDDFGNLVRIKS